MRLEDALEISTVQTAYRPFFIQPNAAVDAQYIVWRGMQDVYIVQVHTFKYVRDLDPSEVYKVIGKGDWTPVAPKEPVGRHCDFDTRIASTTYDLGEEQDV